MARSSVAEEDSTVAWAKVDDGKGVVIDILWT
jgi:hypothetical protein